MKKLTIFFFALITLLTFNACEDTSDPTSPGGLLVSTTWRVDGIYANNAKVPGTEFNISMRFTGTPAFVTINGVPSTAWSLNSTGTQMTLTYPTSTNLTVASNTVDFTVSSTSLVFKATNQDVQFFGGLIKISAGSELRLIPASSIPAAPVTNTTLTTGIWTANGTNAGLFNTSTTPNTLISHPNFTLRFRTVLGINTLTISGIPSPATWSLSANNLLTISYPTGANTYDMVSFQISTLETNSLIFRNETAETIFGIEFNANNQLRMIQQ